MPAASDTTQPTSPAAPSGQPPSHPAARTGQSTPSRLPASIAGAFAAAAYELQQSAQTAGESAEDEDSSLLPKLYASRLGPWSRNYYLTQFKRFDALGRGLPTWNMAAAFFTLAWCCLRGLWQQAAIYLAAVTAVAAFWWFGLRPLLPPAMGYGLGAAMWLVSVAVPGLMGNTWYWRKVRDQTLKTIASSSTMAQAHHHLMTQAITPKHQALALLVIALPLAAAAGAGFALLPAKANWFGIRTQVENSPVATANAAGTAAPVAEVPPAAPSIPAPPQPENESEAIAAAPTEEITKATTPPALSETAAPELASPSPAVATVATPTTAAATSNQLEAGQFYINVGVFSDPDNAKRAIEQLKQAKLPVLVQTLPSNKGEVTRLRTGPFPKEKTAKKAVRQLRALNVQDATVFQYAVEANKKK